MHNLGTVFRFEVVRTLKKKAFWLVALAFPLAIAVVVGIIVLSNQSTAAELAKLQNESVRLAVTDHSGLISDQLLDQLQARRVDSPQAGIEAVTQGHLDAYVHYPADLTTQPYRIYAQDAGLFANNKYDTVAKGLLEQSATAHTSPQLAAVLAGRATSQLTTYRDGQVHDGLREAIVPGLFLVLFYAVIVTFAGQMLTSVTEEKENRVIEMLLVTVRTTTLLAGKILSMAVLALIQMAIILLPVLTGYWALRDRISLPGLDLGSLPLDPVRIAVAVAIFVVGFLVITGLLVAISAAVPTAKEANGFFGVVMLLMFGPLYAASLFVSAPGSPVVQALSYFPLTSPIPLLLRNAVGNLSLPEALTGIGILAITGVIVLMVAVRLFRYGATEYSSRLSFSALRARAKH